MSKTAAIDAATIVKAADFLRVSCKSAPQFGIILGTGLGGFAEEIETDARVPFGEIPGFVQSTAISHAGNLVFGRLGGKQVVAMQGRVHYYEGYSMQQITLPVRVMRQLGCHSLIMSNAVGGMNPQMDPGDIVIVTDHINLMGDNPLIGPNNDELGPRFPDMSQPYDRAYARDVADIALAEGIRAHKGVYVAVAGPNLETAAEYRFLRGIGADIVGMSLVPECLVAVHGGMKVLGLSVVTDRCLPDALEPANVQEIIRIAGEAEPRLRTLVRRFLEQH
jgi:purine-nucleoside phosphorylase